MKHTVIVGDIIGYTDLSNEAKNYLENSLASLQKILKERFDGYIRFYKGDYLECYIPDNRYGLRTALLIKSFVKSLPAQKPGLFDKNNTGVQLFKKYGIRLALGYASLERLNMEKGIIDGQAIYLAGRKISGFSTYNKKKNIIKETMFFLSGDKDPEKIMTPVFALIDFIINTATAKQSRILFLLLNNYTEKEIAQKLSINQSAVNRSSTALGWNAIEKTIHFYEHFFT